MVVFIEHDIDDGRIIKAISDRRQVGFGLVTVENSSRLRLDNIHLEPHARGRGWGSIMLKRLIIWGQEIGAYVLTGDFAPESGSERLVRAFYEKNEFLITPSGKLFKNLQI